MTVNATILQGELARIIKTTSIASNMKDRPHFFKYNYGQWAYILKEKMSDSLGFYELFLLLAILHMKTRRHCAHNNKLQYCSYNLIAMVAVVVICLPGS